MDERQKEDLIRLCADKLIFNCPMAKYTTMGVGGKSEALYRADDLDELRLVIAFLNSEHIPYILIGKGSNLLIKDNGLDGVAIMLRGSLSVIERNEGDAAVVAGAGLPLVELIGFCRNLGLAGIECFAGIPGTVGGAVTMNAGAFGHEFGSRVEDIDIITRQGDVIRKARNQLIFYYRGLEIERGQVVVRARINLEKDSKEAVAGRIADYLKRRSIGQPLDFPSAGSVFKNPPDHYAGRLIEEAGLKGKKIGGAMISEKHANFIVNTGNATAKDIIELIYFAQSKVRDRTGIELEPEIKIVGI
ncbi:UDP-N-acetylenolpyruvoylglucosamine reductase [uncultured Desulfobacterium sp.]|uniref:UDP-N-acetylenolpyruvoylglucosamine reductase n=1 Tax=uncultured Desulfobacterium sp. TaxID=201089 RepID=A0A445MWA5_9BACT|nr:UDP-N-acetylenolpyruvoylglucosamine reductase [uncultured Desulfobacterium sp.]